MLAATLRRRRLRVSEARLFWLAVAVAVEVALEALVVVVVVVVQCGGGGGERAPISDQERTRQSC